MGRRGATVFAGAALVLLAAGCGPIRWVPQDHAWRSYASYSVDPASVEVGGRAVPAVTVTVRRCDAVAVDGPGWLVPTPRIVDTGTGRVLLDEGGDVFGPEGTTILAGGAEVPYVFTVPVGEATELTVDLRCSGPAGTWSFTGCTTATRHCPWTTEGEFTPS